MLYFIIPAILVVIFYVLWSKPDRYRRYWDFKEGIVSTVILVAILSLSSGFIHWAVEDSKMDYTTTYQLKEMQLSSSTEGSYGTFLTIGGGSFGKKGYYYFYAKSPDGSITLGKVEGTEMIFHEIGANDPAYFTCKTHKKNQRYDSDTSYIGHCEFFIPSGKINTDIHVHLNGNV